MLLPLLKAARPHQWVKNLFVAAPLVFARRLDDPEATLRAAGAVACFCILSSAVYLLNDVLDVEKDRAHPLKRHRPIASGALSLPGARAAAIGLALVALAAATALNVPFGAVALGYLGLNLAYSLRLKHVPVVDVLCIALGFLLRVLGGAYAVPVEPSGWLLGCTVLLAGLLGFGKRAHELRVAGFKGATQRLVLERYPPGLLRTLLALLAALTVGLYALYTQSEHALDFFGTRLIAASTIPFVAFGIVRFLWIVQRKADAESPTDSMLRDVPFLTNLLLYGALIALIVYRT